MDLHIDHPGLQSGLSCILGLFSFIVGLFSSIVGLFSSIAGLFLRGRTAKSDGVATTVLSMNLHIDHPGKLKLHLTYRKALLHHCKALFVYSVWAREANTQLNH